MAKELTQTELVFSALKELGAGSYTTRDIMSAMTKEELDRLKHDSKTVSKLLQNLERSGRVKQAEKVRLGSITVSKWKITNNEVSTDKPVVSAASEVVESKTVEETAKAYQTEAEREYFDGFSHPKDSSYSIESLIEDAQNTALLSIASVFSGLKEVVEKSDYSKPSYDVDPLIDGLLEVSDLLSEKIAVKNVIPVVEFLRGLK
jgi:hypothetical protein